MVQCLSPKWPHQYIYPFYVHLPSKHKTLSSNPSATKVPQAQWLRGQKLTISQFFWRLEIQIKVWAGLVPSETSLLVL
jgi:hypothetical protein